MPVWVVVGLADAALETLLRMEARKAWQMLHGALEPAHHVLHAHLEAHQAHGIGGAASGVLRAIVLGAISGGARLSGWQLVHTIEQR